MGRFLLQNRKIFFIFGKILNMCTIFVKIWYFVNKSKVRFETKGCIWKKNYTFLSAILQKNKNKNKKKIVRSQDRLYFRGCCFGYPKYFKWFDLMVKFKSYAYFYEGRWKQPGPISQSLRDTAFCLYVFAQGYNELNLRTKGTA